MAGETAIVINGAQGVGRALSRALGDSGARVILTDPAPGVAADFAGTLGQTGLECDPSGNAALAQIAETTSDLDVAVVSLDGTGADPVSTLSAITLPVVHASTYLAPVIGAGGGGAVLFVLILPAQPDPWHEASAGWLTAATRGLAAQLAPKGIRVNAIVALADEAPPLPRFMAAGSSAPPPEVPLAALPGPRAIAAAALTLCSSDADSMTGQVLRLDGGRA